MSSCVDKVSDVWKGTRQVGVGILSCVCLFERERGWKKKKKVVTRGFGSEPDCIISWRLVKMRLPEQSVLFYYAVTC